MTKVVRFFKNATILIFLVILGFSYYELADLTGPVVIYRGEDGQGILHINKHIYFYASSLFLVVINILLAIIVRLLRAMPMQKLKVPNANFWFADTDRKEKLRDVLMSWVYGLAIILNAFITVFIIKIWMVNRRQGGYPWEYSIYLGILVFVLLGWLGFLFYRLRLKREEFFVGEEQEMPETRV